MWTPQSDGKGERLCFIERKDKSFISNCRDFRREMFLFFDLTNGKTKTRGLFSPPWAAESGKKRFFAR